MMTDSASGITFIATCDLGGICRGRAVPNAESARWTREGTGWVPGSIALSPLGAIVEPNAFGALGDLRLVPDLSTRCQVPAVVGAPPFTLILGDLVNTDGSEWECSSRALLRSAVLLLKAATGLELRASFEHEFTLLGQHPTSAPLSLQALRRAEPFGSDLVRTLEKAGLQPETWHPEYGPGQWEITVGATDALTAADRAILLREIVRHVAEAHGHDVTFSPVPDPSAVGNGVHVHMSLRAADGAAAMFDADRPAQLSAVASAFAAGILRHADALVALTAASPVSSLRFGPGHWSAATTELGYRNRETMLRVCPTLEMEGCVPADHLNIEYRAADATANPWLVMAVLTRAGLEGILGGYGLPESGGPSEGSAPGRALPATLDDALSALAADRAVIDWFPPTLIDSYLLVKRDESRQMAELTATQRCARYSAIY
jgi:glutamine synthetase